MKDKYFLDTNIFVYSFDSSNRKKKQRSITLIEEALNTGRGAVSIQVINEFVNVATRKFEVPLKVSDCLDYIDNALAPLCQVSSSIHLIKQALMLQAKAKYSFYDSLILAAALESDCATLYSEDFQHGFKTDGLTICNPFL